MPATSSASAQPYNDATLPEAMVKTVQHFVPDFFSALAQVKDPRDPTRITYPLPEEILVGILASMVKVESRRNIKFRLGTSPAFIKNLVLILKTFYPKVLFPEDRLLHGCTLNYLLKMVGVKDIHGLRLLVIRSLLRKRCLEQYRLFNTYYPLAIDGTGCLVFHTRHCRHCLTKTHNGKTLYYHPVLEAKLSLANGMALSVESEFIENEREDVPKQDCERKAFYRLAPQLKRDFSPMSICLLLDGLFACEPVFRICADNHWSYIITFKEGSMPAVFAEYEALQKLAPEQVLVIHPKKGVRQTYRWVNDIDYAGRKVNVLECVEETRKGKTRFVWLASFRLNAANVKEIAETGRCRWKIENGFNVQKNGGYELEHAFSEDNVAMKNFYVLMQIAHIFNQLMEKGSLIWDRLRNSMGSLKVFSLKLWAALTETLIDPVRLQDLLAQRIQIRFNTS